MSLSEATPALPLPPGPPYACSGLHACAGVEFMLPPADPRLRDLFDGGPEPTPPLANLAGAYVAWRDWPGHMDFLDPESEARVIKRLERALYLDRWARHIPPGSRVLDLGGGIGRFTTWLLDQGHDVELVDPDLRSLWRAVAHAVDRPGRLDVHWATGERLPELEPVDVIVAAEVLCYTEAPQRVLANLRRVLKPGGVLLMSVEARYGWAAAMDAPGGTLDAALGDGIVHVPGDRWVRTYTREQLAEELAGWAVEEIVATHYIPSGPFEDAAGTLSVDALLATEARLRAHPVLGALNRAWMAVAR
jgi:SAM-dependent methyltransferase